MLKAEDRGVFEGIGVLERDSYPSDSLLETSDPFVENRERAHYEEVVVISGTIKIFP